MRTLKQLSKKEFESLKQSGMLWEFYPEAPEFYEEIRNPSFRSNFYNAFFNFHTQKQGYNE